MCVTVVKTAADEKSTALNSVMFLNPDSRKTLGHTFLIGGGFIFSLASRAALPEQHRHH